MARRRGTHTPSTWQIYDLEIASCRLSGTLPASLYALGDLKQLEFDRTFLSGTLSSQIGMLTSMVGLEMQYTKLSGTLPYEFVLMQARRDLAEISPRSRLKAEHIRIILE